MEAVTKEQLDKVVNNINSNITGAVSNINTNINGISSNNKANNEAILNKVNEKKDGFLPEAEPLLQMHFDSIINKFNPPAPNSHVAGENGLLFDFPLPLGTFGVSAIAKKGDDVIDVSSGVNPLTGNPVTSKAIQPLASTTKLIVHTLLMMLWEKSVINMDEPISKYIPEAQGVTYKVIREVYKTDDEYPTTYTENEKEKMVNENL